MFLDGAGWLVAPRLRLCGFSPDPQDLRRCVRGGRDFAAARLHAAPTPGGHPLAARFAGKARESRATRDAAAPRPPPTPHGVQRPETIPFAPRGSAPSGARHSCPWIQSARVARSRTRSNVRHTDGDAVRRAAAVAILYKGGEGVLAGGVQASARGDRRALPAQRADGLRPASAGARLRAHAEEDTLASPYSDISRSEQR